MHAFANYEISRKPIEDFSTNVFKAVHDVWTKRGEI